MAATASSQICAKKGCSQHEKRLVAGDRQQPGCQPGYRLEAIGATPNVQEDLVDEFLCHRMVAGKAKEEAKDARMMVHVQRLESASVAVGNKV